MISNETNRQFFNQSINMPRYSIKFSDIAQVNHFKVKNSSVPQIISITGCNNPPISKTASPTCPADFRPISITPILSRLLERCVVRNFLYPSLDNLTIFIHITLRSMTNMHSEQLVHQHLHSLRSSVISQHVWYPNLMSSAWTSPKRSTPSDTQLCLANQHVSSFQIISITGCQTSTQDALTAHDLMSRPLHLPAFNQVWYKVQQQVLCPS